ncbi:predicted protein [Thalassiosira pseudonana CCMP1335]|uniref:Plus3 domain-containing protein n=1 Tax=Thalassiosira pseudonana TaxID=35128 RepID=B5YN06_THAPS|nr:predicted protein [Thalassiosira pseudonana CCMP1335]ACI64902.1 predicted protein [Thalassiosira pseudonana CCMP1335]
MVRTKKHFRPPSSPSSSSSSEEEEDDNYQPQIVGARGGGKQLQHFGGGKQMSVMAGRGGGKQLRMADQGGDEEDSSDDSSDDDEDEPPSKSVVGGGKQLRVGGGKQLVRPPVAADDEDDDSDDSDDDSEEEEDEKPVYRPAGGKQFGGKAFAANRGMGKQLARPPTPEMDDDDSSSDDSEEEAPAQTTTVIQGRQGGGKILRPATKVASADEKEDSADDMEESDEEEEEEEKVVEKAPTPAPAPVAKAKPAAAKAPAKKKEPEPEVEVEPEQPKRRGRPARAAAARPTRSTRSAKKVVDDSDDSSDEELELDMDTYDTQKLVQGDDDKKYLDSLPELEREAILAERFEKLKSEADMKKALRENKRREKEQQKMQQAQKPKAKTPPKKRVAASKPKKEPPKKRGRKAKKIVESESEDEDDEDYEGVPDTSADAEIAKSMAGKRVSSRNLDAKGNKFKKAAALAKIRQNRASKAPAKEESDSDLDYGRDSDDSDDDYEESTMLKPWQQKGKKASQLQSSDDESVGVEKKEDKPKDTSERRTEDAEADLEDYIKVSIPRRRLIRWCNEPFFEDAIKNCYVRLGIGRDNKTQKACYRLCKIVGIETKSEYSFPADDKQKPVTTDKWIKVSFGKFTNAFKMLTVSDHRPSADDVSKYVGQLKTERQHSGLLTKKAANKRRRRQDELVNNYTYTKEDIEMLIKEKKKRNKKSMNIGMEKTRIAIIVQAARDAVEEAEKRLEDAKVEQMEADDSMVSIAESNVTTATELLEDAKQHLQAMVEEQQRINVDEDERKSRLKGSSKVQNWVKVNQRAKLANQNADFAAYKEQIAKEKAEATAEPKFDPFARRKVKPKNLWEVGSKQSSDKGFDANGVQEEKKEILMSERDDANVGKDGDKDKRDDNDDAQKMEVPGQSNQFAFDDDIMLGGDIATLGLGLKKPKVRARKGISLDDYQEKKTSGTL